MNVVARLSPERRAQQRISPPFPACVGMRRPEALSLVALLLLAGCTTPEAEVATTEVPVDEGVDVVSRAPTAAANATTSNGPILEEPSASALPARIRFGEPVALPMVGGYGGGEPNIAALPDGTLFVAAPTGMAESGVIEGGGYLWRSQDGGATWEQLRGPSGTLPVGPFCSCDSDVVTSPDGWVYYTDWWIAGYLGPGNYLVERSSDGGETWDATPITSREAITRVDRQWLVAGEDGFVGLFYNRFGIGFGPVVVNSGEVPDVATGIHAVFSRDHGATWSDPVVVVPHGAQIGHARILPDGTLVQPYGYNEYDAEKGSWRSPSFVNVAVSTDGGQTWESHPVAQAPEGFDNLWAVQADVDRSGAIHVAWSARVDDDIMATYVATSRDGGRTWTDPLALRAEGLNFLPWVAAYGNDTVAVGWYGGDATGEPTEADEEWFAYVAESHDGGETFAVHRVSEEPVKTGPMCPRGAACDGDRELLDYVSMVYDATGALHYAFARSDDDMAVTLVANELRELVDA